MEFIISGIHFPISEEMKNYRYYRKLFSDLADQVASEFDALYTKQNHRLEDIIQNGSNQYAQCMYPVIQTALKCLAEKDILSYDAAGFWSKYGKYFDYWSEAYDHLEEQYAAIVLDEKSMDEYRTLRRKTRGRVVGGGFGVGGSTTVSADQTAADAVIKLIDAIGTVSKNSGSAISAARSGYDALTDAQKKLVTNYNKLTQAEQVFSSLFSAEDSLSFTDMNGHWSYDAVSYVYKNNLMNGVNASRFSPDGTLNRAMMVTMLYRMASSPAVSGGSAFSDVPSGKWYSDAVQWASANGVVNGVGRDRFAPEAQITREQMASMMMRYAQFNQYNTSKSADLSAFNDAGSISSWALESMKWANAAGLINGRTASTIAPQGTATRAEAATILMRFCEMSK